MFYFFFGVLQSDDYISVKLGGAAAIDETIGALLMGGGDSRVPVALPVVDDAQGTTKVLTEAQLPPYPANVTPVDGAWQTVGNTG